MTAVATGCFGQPRLVERRNLNHVDQLDLLNQQLGDTVAAVHDDRRNRIKIDQRNLDLAAIASVNCAGAVDDRKPQPHGQPGARVHQPYHSVRDGDRDAGCDQSPLSRRKFDMLGAVKVDAGVTVVGPAGQRKPTV